MIVSVFLNVSRRLRVLFGGTRNKKRDMRLNTPSSVMFIQMKGKSVFKFLNSK